MRKENQVVLVIDDQKVNREILHRILEDEYTVLEAENGQEALDVLEKRPHGVSAILLDLMMPVMDGYAFLGELKKFSRISSLPVIVITGEKDSGAELKALELGAWDFVSKPYHVQTMKTRLKNVIVRSQFHLINELKHIYEHDPLTDLHNRTCFFTETRRMLDTYKKEKFAMVRMDIDHFHIINTFWGEEEGDKLIKHMAGNVRKMSQQARYCTYARISADIFCLCEPYDQALIHNQIEFASKQLAKYSSEYLIEPSFGIYIIEHHFTTFP